LRLKIQNGETVLTRKVQLAFGSAVAILLVVGGISYRSIVISSESDRWVRHTHEVLESLQNLVADMTSIESSDRGFALTGEESYLESYRANILSAEQDEAAIRNLTKDNPKQQLQLPVLEELIAQKVRLGDVVIRLRRVKGVEAAADATGSGRGQRTMTAFLAIVSKMHDEELRLLVLRDVEAKRRQAQTKTVLFFGTLLGVLIALGAGWIVFHDIAVRKQGEEHLAQMEARYRGLLEAAPDAMVVVNPGGEIVLLNVQAERQFGYNRNELAGQKVSSIIPKGFAERLIADGTRSAADALAQQIGTGIELIGRRKEGSQFPIEIMLSPLESAEGILVTAAIRDISVRKTAEKHLAEMVRELSIKHRLLDSVVEGTTDLIYIRDLENRFTLANSACAKLFGRSVPEVVGRSMRELLPNDSYDAVAQSDQEIVHAGATCTIEEVAEIDGIPRLFLTTKGPYRDADLKIIGTIGISREITERKKAEERLVKTVAELKRSNEELQQFAYVASHDLQEPLRMVASYTQLLAKRYKGRLDSDADEFIAFAVDGCNRMQGLIQDLLAYSRAGATGKALCDVSGEDALQAALTNLRITIEQSRAVVSHDSLPVIKTDETQLTQVLQNLIGNAIKYRSAEVPRVHVSATKIGGNEWTFSVRDNGLGIAPQYFERIFILFQRLHGRNEFEGTGIGLAICKKVLERLGGRIWVESQLEKGSTFYFALPERSET
jgi:PAS domain S-box-containing protein